MNRNSRTIDDTPFILGGTEKAEKPMVSFSTINVKESDLHYDFEMEVPGFSIEDIEIKIKKRKLIVKGEKTVDIDLDDNGFIRREHRRETFKREFELDFWADEENIIVDFNKGVLTFRIHRR